MIKRLGKTFQDGAPILLISSTAQKTDGIAKPLKYAASLKISIFTMLHVGWWYDMFKYDTVTPYRVLRDAG